MKSTIETLHCLGLGLCIGAFIQNTFLYIEQGQSGDIIWMIVMGICIVYNFNHLNKKTG